MISSEKLDSHYHMRVLFESKAPKDSQVLINCCGVNKIEYENRFKEKCYRTEGVPCPNVDTVIGPPDESGDCRVIAYVDRNESEISENFHHGQRVDTTFKLVISSTKPAAQNPNPGE